VVVLELVVEVEDVDAEVLAVEVVVTFTGPQPKYFPSSTR
jgi:hypothetical protein